VSLLDLLLLRRLRKLAGRMPIVCSACGHPAASQEEMAAHVRGCRKHPLWRENDRLRSALRRVKDETVDAQAWRIAFDALRVQEFPR
jgi:hypothetical protein